MKPIVCITISLMVAIFGPLSDLSAQSVDKTVDVGIAQIFVPNNLGSNREVVILASGLLSPQGCQRWDSYSINHESAYVHVLNAKAKFKDFCVGQILPFTREINLGNLEPGVHMLKYADEYLKPAEKTFEVKAN